MPKPMVRSPRYAMTSYKRQKAGAKSRGIEFNLTFEEWMQIWNDSGKFNERGTGHGYVMCRKGDVGPYEVGNVYIETGVHNIATQPGFNSIALGVSRAGARFRAARTVKGKLRHLGTFDTIEEAKQAYLDAWPDRVQKVFRQR